MIDKINEIGDKFVTWEIETLAKPFLNRLGDAMQNTLEIFTASIPDFAAVFTIACAVGLMLSGNAPKWLSRWVLGMGGAIIWLILA